MHLMPIMKEVSDHGLPGGSERDFQITVCDTQPLPKLTDDPVIKVLKVVCCFVYYKHNLILSSPLAITI